jgi:capsular exopolysaccharide synthesis family protein
MNDTSEVKLHFLDYWRVIKLRLGLIMLAFFLVMITAGVTTYFLPREYFSKVTMEVKEDNSGPVQMFNQSGGQRGYNQQFVTSQFNIIQKTEILYPVIERLDLTKEFSPPGGARLPLQQVFLKLKKAMQLQEVRNTQLIEIGVYNTNPQLAANIANTIANVYAEKRQSNTEQSVMKSLASLEEEVRKKNKEVEEAGAAAAKIRSDQEINDPDPENYGSTPTTVDARMVQDANTVNQQRSLVGMLTVQLEQIEKLKPEELMEALRTLKIEDPIVIQHVPELQRLNIEEAQKLNSGLGERHPEVLSIRARQTKIQDILTNQLESIRRVQVNNLKIEEGKLEKYEAQFAESQEKQREQKAKMGEYIDAKSKYLVARKLMESAQANVQAERMKINMFSDVVKIWEKAEPSIFPARPNVPAYMALAAIVGLVVGVGLAFFIEYLDTSVKTLDDVERFLQAPVLAVVPKGVSTLIKNAGDTADAEVYRILRANVEFNKPSRDANTFTLISGGPGEGKSTTLNNLAYTCAKGGYNVLVVDADLRRPSQHLFFDVDNSVGLIDYLQGKTDLEDITKTTKIDNLSFIPSGQLPDDSVGILNSQRMTDLVRKLKTQYDLVFFDSPPILGVSDGSVLASEVDMTIMVVQHRRFPRAMLQRVKQAVINVGGRLIGVVLNNVDARHDEGYGYYNQYADYYAPRQKEASRRTESPSRRSTPAATASARPREEREDY